MTLMLELLTTVGEFLLMVLLAIGLLAFKDWIRRGISRSNTERR